MSQSLIIEELNFTQSFGEQEKEIINHDVKCFLTDLVSHFSERRHALLAERDHWKS